jgi:hypothetical protein
VIRATIERRLLVNFRVDMDALVALLPPPFRPVVVGGHGIAGICLIRLGHVRPAGVPRVLGVTSENAAHRVAVEWDTPDGPVTGVYIPRRDTSSLLTTVLGGRAFPGWHHRADFEVAEGDGSYRVAMTSRDGQVEVMVAARRATDVMPGSVFPSLDHASAFFRCAPVGYAATPDPRTFDGVQLAAGGWAMEPLHVDDVRSTYFAEVDTAVLDSACLMENLDSTWKREPSMLAAAQR